MPKIQFSDLPRAVWEHLLQRADERRISVAACWRSKNGFGDWYKDFGSFILCGTGPLPKTVLEKGMKPFGNPVG